jgi:hypothetical protein
MKSGRYYRLKSIVSGGFAILILYIAPTSCKHRLIVTPDYFSHRVGSWYSPVETRINFDSMQHFSIAPFNDEGRREYELRCYSKNGGDPVRIPIYDMMNKALPEIFDKATQRGVIVPEKRKGQQIPAELTK